MLGATGLIGGLCLDELLKEDRYGGVIALVRRPLGLSHDKLREVVVDFSRPESYSGLRCDDVFSCLGTTTARTPSRQDYRRVDFDIPLAVARAALERGASRLLLVTSVGADAKSSVFYTRLKGELEEAASALPFEAVHIFRPSFLLGDRDEKRPAEKIFLKIIPFLDPLFLGPARVYRSIPAAVVAKAMVRAALEGAPGVAVHQYDAIRALGL